MEVLRDLAAVRPAPDGRAIAVGTFDGVHLGHRRVIGSAVDWGRSHGSRVAVVTFDPHPLELLRPGEPPHLLSPTAIKADLIAGLDVDELIVIPFTDEFSRLEAEEFCHDVLAGKLAARHVSVGENFRFGHKAQGDASLLRNCDEFETAVVQIVEHGGAPVSSTRIRELLEQGDVAGATELLGAPFQLEGIVTEGDARGRLLGIPTANVTPEPNLLVPGKGIYAGRALDHPAAISVGVRPTFEEDGELLVEAYLLDFTGDLYGRMLRVVFLERIRDELRFDSADELVAQMRRDLERTRQIVLASPS
jgi:riboflavin kinase / FMN adenylyltransferase